jgi:ferredoxin
VFGGRIPKLVTDKIRKLHGNGKRAVTLAVYGTRAYEDALLELNRAVEGQGFQVAASAALIARHSIVPEVGAGRPDEKDQEEIRDFAKSVLEKLRTSFQGTVKVPGNDPYKEAMNMPATPISLPVCNQCKRCVSICPAEAIYLGRDGDYRHGSMYSVYGMYSGLSARSTDSSTAIAGADEREAWGLENSPQGE